MKAKDPDHKYKVTAFSFPPGVLRKLLSSVPKKVRSKFACEAVLIRMSMTPEEVEHYLNRVGDIDEK